MSHFENYYMRQAHGNGMPVFSGLSLQKGHGIGSILSSAFRSMVPVLKSGGKAVAKQALQTGINILGDVVGGESIKKASKRRLKEGGSQLIKRAKTQLYSEIPPPPPPHYPPQKRIKRRGTSKRKQSRGKSSSKKHQDIFS